MTLLLLTIGVFLCAGLVKGTVGLGLPVIAMGLLVLVLSPAEAAALMVLPAFVTNVWQMATGGHIRALVRRLRGYLLCLVAVTLLGTGWLPDSSGGVGSAVVGVILALYALVGLIAAHPTIRPEREGWMAPVVGALTGVVTATTGIASVPSAPFLQALGLPRDHLIQALGLSFTLSSLALATSLSLDGKLAWDDLPLALAATAAALAGMRGGRLLRHRLPQERFTAMFLCGLLLLGAYLALRPLIASF